MELLTCEEVAGRLKISRAKAYGLTRSGDLPCIRIGSNVRVDAADLERWLERKKVPARVTQLVAERKRR